jgi:acyl-CoA synthetase (AMP-forming)/AMP-acid ligase II
MHLSSLVEIVESSFAERVILGTHDAPVTGERFGRLVRGGAATLSGYTALVYVGENHPLLPVALFSAAWARVPFVPVNYRVEDDQMNSLVARQPGALVLADAASAQRLTGAGPVIVVDEWLGALSVDAPDGEAAFDDDEIAVILYTSGTTSEPKSALLRHRHLTAYLFGSVEFGGATEAEAALVAVPPYHIAGIANMLSNMFAGRRLVYLTAFDPDVWLATVREERITNAMVVPTMLSRIVDAVGNGAVDGAADVPSLRFLSYGGAKVSDRVLFDALAKFPDTGFVNAYGLTETASTIAVLGPDDHRAAVESDDPEIRRRIASAGRVLPTVEIELRDDSDNPVPPGETGMIFVRGEQVAGEYATGSVLGADGWFCTQDRGWLDSGGYLFIEGRADDTIIRGGENIAPAEIEEVLLAHPAVSEACVVGMPDVEWGQQIVAVVVVREGHVVSVEALREHVRAQLRGSKTPDTIEFRDHLPYTETGKLLRRVVLEEILAASGA